MYAHIIMHKYFKLINMHVPWYVTCMYVFSFSTALNCYHLFFTFTLPLLPLPPPLVPLVLFSLAAAVPFPSS